MAKTKETKAKEPEADGLPQKEQREFTTRHKGGHVVYLQKMVPGIPNGTKATPPLKRAITVRLQSGIKFDPFVECGPDGKNRLFRDITPENAFTALKEKADDRESPVVLWDDRPMTEQESAHHGPAAHQPDM